MPGLKPEFTMEDIERKIDGFKKEKLTKIFEVLSFVGIQAVNYAKNNHTYNDQTGNLTSSIGYAIINNGEIKRSMVTHDKGAQLIDELAAQYPKGMILVVVAGMEYAAAVESKGYDVISGASFVAQDLMTYMKKQLGAIL